MSEAALAERPQISMKAPVVTKETLEAIIANPSFQEAVRDILPDHLSVERIMKMALVASSRQPLLYKCTQGSIIQALMRSAELGLDCSGTLGLGYLVPYWNSSLRGYEAQFIPGYRGIIELAKRARPQMQIEARVVHRNDFFEFEYGLDQKLVHRPAMGEQGDIDYFYCITREPGLLPEFTVMTKEEVDMIRERSKSRDKSGQIVGPWKTDYSEMGRKTIVKRHAKYLALSVELQKAVNFDDEQYRSILEQQQLAAAETGGASSVGINAMKNRMKLVTGGEQNRESETEPEPEGSIAEAMLAEPPDAYDYMPGDGMLDEPEEVDVAIAADDAREAARPVADSDITEEEAAELRLFELRRSAVETYRSLATEDRERYLAATKWLGVKGITELNEKRLNEFLKKFA